MILYLLLVMMCGSLVAMEEGRAIPRKSQSVESFPRPTLPSTPPIAILPLETKSRSLTALPFYYSSPAPSTSPLTFLEGKQFPDNPLALIALFKELLREKKIELLAGHSEQDIKNHIDNFSLALSPQLKSLYISQAPKESTYPSKLKKDETKAYKQYWSQKSSHVATRTTLSTVEEKLKELDKALLHYVNKVDSPYVRPTELSAHHSSSNVTLLPYDFLTDDPLATTSNILLLEEELAQELAEEIKKETKETL